MNMICLEYNIYNRPSMTVHFWLQRFVQTLTPFYHNRNISFMPPSPLRLVITLWSNCLRIITSDIGAWGDGNNSNVSVKMFPFFVAERYIYYICTAMHGILNTMLYNKICAHSATKWSAFTLSAHGLYFNSMLSPVVTYRVCYPVCSSLNKVTSVLYPIYIYMDCVVAVNTIYIYMHYYFVDKVVISIYKTYTQLTTKTHLTHPCGEFVIYQYQIILFPV